MPCNNVVQLSSAGSGKTTEMINEILADAISKIIIVTYTRENCATIESEIRKKNAFVPKNVKVLSWANFIMRDCVRPFHSNKYNPNIQNFLYDIPRDKTGKTINLNFPKTDMRRYFSAKSWIYYDYATDFAIECNTDNCVISRLEKIYDKIYIDEIQDLAGYDLDLLELLLKSNITIKMYGDIRQATYSTQNVAKNNQYRGVDIIKKFNEWATPKKGQESLLTIEEKNISHRCCQEICNVADLIFPNLTKTVSQASNVSKLKGVWFVNSSNIKNVLANFDKDKVTILRWNKKTTLKDIDGYLYYNFGECKGCTFQNVVILCTPKFLEFLEKNKLPDSNEIKTKLYIAVTRARHNVFFYNEKDIKEIKISGCTKWV